MKVVSCFHFLTRFVRNETLFTEIVYKVLIVLLQSFTCTVFTLLEFTPYAVSTHTLTLQRGMQSFLMCIFCFFTIFMLYQ